MIITFSGIDGSGKTHFAKKIADILKEKYPRTFHLSPKYSVNNIIKSFCEFEFGDKYAYIPKMDASMYIHGLTIDWLDFLSSELKHHSDKIVVCDRYMYDVIAQGFHYEANVSATMDLVRYFPAPDISFYLAVSPEEAYRRLKDRTFPKMHHLESLDNLILLHDAYDRVKSTLPWMPNVIQNESDDKATIKIIKTIENVLEMHK